MPNFKQDSGMGYLVVTASTAQDAIPVEGALVTVSYVQEDGSTVLLYTATTDRSGQTDHLALPTPPRTNSTSPGQVRPYAEYNVQVDHPRYRTAGLFRLNVFDGITADLPVYLLPLEEQQNRPGSPQVTVLPPHVLNQQKGD